jgi:hypothetical protein
MFDLLRVGRPPAYEEDHVMCSGAVEYLGNTGLFNLFFWDCMFDFVAGEAKDKYTRRSVQCGFAELAYDQI